jgi:cathepsin B
MRILVLSCLLVVALASLSDMRPAVLKSTIEQINSNPHSTWKAGHNKRWDGLTIGQVKRQMGVKSTAAIKALPVMDYEPKALPTSFDARAQWGATCPSLNEIRDQAACGSCWAFGAVEAQTDRTCINSSGALQPHLSAGDMLSCCDSCGDGCEGGDPGSAWMYWVQTGVVTGGNYNSNQGCYPYPIPGCDHHVKGKLPPCGSIVPTPACQTTCSNGDSWNADLNFGSYAYQVNSDVDDIRTDIMTYGPVEAAFTVYADFLTYKSGVYQYQSGSELGGHAVKIFGWGVESGTPYWWVANSWNVDWGMQGYFKILRGQDECGIEDDIVGGWPLRNTTRA